MGAIDPCSHKSSALQLYRALVLLLWVSFLAHVQSASFPAVDSDLSWIETLSWKPRAFLWHNFLSNEEADHIIRIAKPFLKRSTVVGQGGKATITDVRSSYGTFLGRLSDPIVAGLEERVAQWTHINVSHQEDLQILRYEHMQSYRPHHDSLIEDGPRIATVLLYLSDAAEGGETAFPDHSEWLDESLPDRFGPFSNCARGHVAVKPRKGDALLFYSMKPTGDLDPASLHTGCPVLEGTKWTATVWIHSKPFRIDDLYVGEKGPLTFPEECVDVFENCREWSERGECDRNPAFMVGDAFGLGSCRRSCGTCDVCREGDTVCMNSNRIRSGYLPLDEINDA